MAVASAEVVMGGSGGGGGGGHTDADCRLAERAFSRMLSESSGSKEKSIALLTVLCMLGKITFNRVYRRFRQAIKRTRRKRSRLIGRRQSTNGEQA
ncbi:hypothetical protein TSAR_002021 [Trichomalopsis sarcophagae]|uniref:Uncharacterized protein n=1 Tax=Trichomalopsis sarcophagae TaxID=543379 RepID=A0A232EDW8_9HYME|nr:hypothetical protein TSAR_002021 [Trichomalopsis sarcophagae]